MAELCGDPAAKARKAYSNVLQAMQEPGTARNVAQILGVSEATVSRTKTEKLEDAVTLLYHLGFKVVPNDMKCFPSDYMAALHTLARMHVESGPKLEWD
jgi:hypothetical protein